MNGPSKETLTSSLCYDNGDASYSPATDPLERLDTGSHPHSPACSENSSSLSVRKLVITQSRIGSHNTHCCKRLFAVEYGTCLGCWMFTETPVPNTYVDEECYSHLGSR
ncbi:unnamed protein product [Leuciscus chuanchicus]